MDAQSGASIVSIKNHPRFRRRRPAYGNKELPKQLLGTEISNVIQPFTFEKIENRYGSRLESLKTAHLRFHEGNHFLFVEIAVSKPAPPEGWLSQLKIRISDPLRGTIVLEAGKVFNRGNFRRNPNTVSYEIVTKSDWLADLEPHPNATVTIESPCQKFRLNGNLHQLLACGG